MPKPKDGSSQRSISIKLGSLIVLVVGVVVTIALLTAILYRPGSFTVVAQNRGLGSIEFKFNQNQVSFSEVLDALLSEQPGSQVDASQRKALIANILRTHGFYSIPGDDAVSALRTMEDTEGTHAFMHSVRELLYDLAGPFARPITFSEARDGRLLEALEDLAKQEPASPLVVRLWEMYLNLQGIFSPRAVKASVSIDQTLQAGIAETCNGSPLLEKGGIIQASVKSDEPQSMIKVFVHKARLCKSPTAEEMLSGKEVKLWLSSADMENLLLRKEFEDRVSIKADLLPEPAALVSE
jgi:hypothetical protein